MDALHDNSHRTWLQIADETDGHIPEYVLSHCGRDEKQASELQDNCFADPVRRLFPVLTQGETWLSGAYFIKNAHNLPYESSERAWVFGTIKQAAEFHGIADDFAKMEGLLTAVPCVKQAADDDSNYGWVLRDQTGSVLVRKYPMFDAEGVKRASGYFAESRERYPLGIRRHIACNIMQKAAQHAVPLSDVVRREAGCGIPCREVLMSEIYERALLTKDAESAILLANINEMLAGMDGTAIAGSLDKIAEVIDAFDTQADLTRYYGKKLLMPADFLFDVDVAKTAAVLEDSVELDRHVFSLTKLADLDPSIYGNVLGDEFLAAIVKQGSQEIDSEKLADNLYSLPRPDKAALEQHLLALFSR